MFIPNFDPMEVWRGFQEGNAWQYTFYVPHDAKALVAKVGEVIQWDRTTEWVNKNIRNHFEVLSQEEGIMEERTGLHPNEFIETRRHTFTKTVEHNRVCAWWLRS